MSFDEKIAALTQRLPGLLDHVDTEEATKNALVLPFISALGYDPFNPREVVPEFTADVGTKKGEKVDYAIQQDGQIMMLFECKKAGTDLNDSHTSQLYRYFSVTHARIAILTNGYQYRFFSDLDEPNKMDSLPFLELDLLQPRKGTFREVKKLAKSEFDLEKMLSTASELKYTSAIYRALAFQIEQPDEEFVRFFVTKVSPGTRFTATTKETFTPLVSKAADMLIRDRVNNRLRGALESEGLADAGPSAAESGQGSAEEELTTIDGIETTEDELEAYRIVRAIVCQAVKPERIAHRDTKSYMGVLLDDNNRKPICRLRFNSSQKYVGVFDAEKNETRIPIENITDIYLLSDQLLKTVMAHEEG